jgi:hypothetical protein
MRFPIAVLAGLQALLCVAGLVGELSPDQRQLIETFQAYRRVAAGYLRTQNADLGAVEIERLRDSLTAGRGKILSSTPTDTSFLVALARTEELVAEALKAIDGGDIERSHTLLEQSGQAIDAWRKANGIRLFSDCIAEISAASEPLDGRRSTATDLTDANTGAQIVAAANNIIAVLDRCDGEAADTMRSDPAFRRLFDGMRASLRQIPEAVSARDGALLHRLLIEQRSFEQLLSFRFG